MLLGTPATPPGVFLSPDILLPRKRTFVAEKTFFSTNKRFHIEVPFRADGLPKPGAYDPVSGERRLLPLHVFRAGARAAAVCAITNGGVHESCEVQFDLGGTPRISSLPAPAVGAGGVLRIRGLGLAAGDDGVRPTVRLVKSGTPGANKPIGCVADAADVAGAWPLGVQSWAPQLRSRRSTNVQELLADDVGTWGGSCTCPDGEVY